MVPITHSEVGANEDLAREVLIVARTIAPCLATVEEGSELKKDALAVIRRVYNELSGRGNTLVKSQRMGPAAVEYRDVESAFAGQPTRALRALCGASRTSGHSVGSFPTDRPISRVWPEGR